MIKLTRINLTPNSINFRLNRKCLTGAVFFECMKVLRVIVSHISIILECTPLTVNQDYSSADCRDANIRNPNPECSD